MWQETWWDLISMYLQLGTLDSFLKLVSMSFGWVWRGLWILWLKSLAVKFLFGSWITNWFLPLTSALALEFQFPGWHPSLSQALYLVFLFPTVSGRTHPALVNPSKSNFWLQLLDGARWFHLVSIKGGSDFLDVRISAPSRGNGENLVSITNLPDLRS